MPSESMIPNKKNHELNLSKSSYKVSGNSQHNDDQNSSAAFRFFSTTMKDLHLGMYTYFTAPLNLREKNSLPPLYNPRKRIWTHPFLQVTSL